MGLFRTSSLFHYTEKESLKQILRIGLYPNYCSEDFSTGNETFIVGIPMVSFCDIPLMRSKLFTDRYNKKYAIALKKEWGLKKNINPLLYIQNESIIHALKLYRTKEVALHRRLQEYGSDGNRITINLKPGENCELPELKDFINHGIQSYANRQLWGYCKKYYDEKRGTVNYEENEWRYIVLEDTKCPWFWSKEEYEQWRGDKTEKKPESSEYLKEQKLTFEVSDITHIIVENEQDVLDFISYIKEVNMIGGNDLTEEQKNLLITKIISWKDIENDF